MERPLCTCKYFITDYENDLDGVLIFQCPHGGAVTGVSSFHDNGKEDRRFKFQCCESTGETTH